MEKPELGTLGVISVVFETRPDVGQLKPGTLVLAAGFDEQDNLAGWWEAIVVRVDDDEFLVRWRDDPNEPRVSRSREYVALLHPNLTSS